MSTAFLLYAEGLTSLLQAAERNGPNSRGISWTGLFSFNTTREEASVVRDYIQIQAGFGTEHRLGEVGFSRA